jgi:hypothetical protein
MLKDRARNRTRCGSTAERKDVQREQVRAYKYVAPVYEAPHPMRKVPGIRHCYWNGEIGRWVKVQ